MLLWMMSAHAATIEIAVSDPAIVSLVLECANGTYRADVKGGIALFDHLPNNCQVYTIRRTGVVTDPGKWTCLLDACTQKEISHRDVEDAPGRVNIILSSELPKGSSFELTCPGGFRNRSEIVANVAVFDSVPAGNECTLFFKGTVLGRFNGMGPGTWTCGILGSTAVCQRR